nr:4-hydroxybenzoate octaprenyltransferase [Salaquimonas pukyongi]
MNLLDRMVGGRQTDAMNDTDKMVADALRGSWVHRLLPQSLWPYAQLARWERPIGWKLLMWPCWWAATMAFAMQGMPHGNLLENFRYVAGETILPFYLALFFLGAFVMRGAGCTYNDLVDEDIDAKVARTRSRPLPSGRVTKKQAIVFLVLQLLAGLVILLQFNWTTVVTGLISVVTILVYPFMKRITWWPQLFLGFAFSWGALVGWTAIMDAMNWPAIILYTGCICWVIAYDTMYACQDIEDDALVGVKSTARLFAENTKLAVSALYAAALGLFALAFWLTAMPWPAWLGLAGGATHMIWQIRTLDIHDPANCLVRFKSNSGFGWIIFAGLFVSAVLHF